MSQEHLSADVSQVNVISGARDRVLTERGLAHQLELKEESLRKAISLWKASTKRSHDILISSVDVSLISNAIEFLSDSYLDVMSNIQVIKDLNPEYASSELDSLHIEHEQVMSNLRAKRSSLSAEEVDDKSVGHSSQGSRSGLADRTKLTALKVKHQVGLERIAKMQQELAEMRIQSQSVKAELDAIDMVEQAISYNQVESKSIIGQSADHQNYSSGIGSQYPQSISYSVPVCHKSEVITSGYSYSPPVTSSVSQASNVTSLASGYTSSSLSVQPVIGSISSANHSASYSVPSSSQSMYAQPAIGSRSFANQGASYSVPPSSQSNFHGSSFHNNPVDHTYLANAHPPSQAPICHTGVGNCFSSASLPNPSYVSQDYRVNQSQFGSFPHSYNGCSTQQTLQGAYVNASHVPPPQQFQSGYNTCTSVSRRPLPEPRQFSGEDCSDFLDYPSWRCSFQTLIANSGISNPERIYYLGSYVKGKALEAIKGYLAIGDDSSYHAALSLLDERYGNHFVLCNAFRVKLDSWSKISNNDRAGLRSYADFLNQCLLAKNKFNLNILDDEFENVKMLDKLPSWMTGKWARIVYDSRRNTNSFPAFSEFVNFVTRESDVCNDPILLSSSRITRRSQSRSTTSAYTHSTGTSDNTNKRPCTHCNDSHFINNCSKFLSLPMSDRKAFIFEKRLCFGCLKPSHVKGDCKHKLECTICKKCHPSALHYVDNSTSANTQISEDDNVNDHSESVATTSCFTSELSSKYCSMIIPVYVHHESCPKKEILIYCMLDTQSDSSFIRSDIMKKLDISGQPINLSLSTMDRSNQIVPSKKVTGLKVRGLRCSDVIDIPQAYSRDLIPGNRQHIPTPSKIKDWPHLAQIGSCLSEELDVPIAMLIGYNCNAALMPRDVIPADGISPYAERSALGWGVVGPLHHQKIVSNQLISYEVSKADQSESDHYSSIALRTCAKEVYSLVDLCKILDQEFHDTDLHSESLSIEDKRFISLMDKNAVQRADGHLEMPLPFKNCDKPLLPCNEKAALMRLNSLRERLKRDRQYFDDYSAFMSELIRSGHARKVEDSGLTNPGFVWFLPHHGVYNENKPGKIRIVFDGSIKYQGVCLNDELLQGPILTNHLLGVLCRFRKDLIAVSCDIKSMFHQFYVSPGYTDYLRFFWYENNDIEAPPSVFSMQVHLFGATSSPACANYGLRKVASLYETEFRSEVSAFIKRSFYVDDGLTSCQNSDEAISLIKETTNLCSKGGLTLHKIISNSKEVMQAFNSDREDISKELPGSSVIERALGVTWCIHSDTFQVKIVLPEKPCTRRGILSVVSSIYDPIGLISPYVLEGKRILQQLCVMGSGWDDPISADLVARWQKWLSRLDNLGELRIPRCINPLSLSVTKVELHYFSDACFAGYGNAHIFDLSIVISRLVVPY